MIICVSSHWDDPGLNDVKFINLNGTNSLFVSVIQKAMQNKNKEEHVNCNDADHIYSNTIIYATLPCQVDDSITLWL